MNEVVQSPLTPTAEAVALSRPIAAEPELIAEVPRAMTSGRMALLLGTGVAEITLLGGLVVLYTNFPPGYNVLYGLSLGSLGLFRRMIPYPSIPLDAGRFTLVAIATLLLLWIVYLVASWALPTELSGETIRPYLAVIGGITVLASTVLLAMPPVLSGDIYHTILFGRMVAFHHLNPYVVSDAALRNDPLWSLASWQDVTTHYGAVWTLISAALAEIGAGNNLLTVLIFKSVVVLFNLVNCFLVFWLARDLGAGAGVRALLFYAWNPLILIESAASGHNEIVMMTFALLGLWLIVHRRTLPGVVALVLSVLVTYLTGILALFVVVRLLALQRTWPDRMVKALRIGGVAGLTAVALFAPFWAGPRTFARLLDVGATFKTPFRYALRMVVAHLLAGRPDPEPFLPIAGQMVSIGLNAIFAALVLVLTWRLTSLARGDQSAVWGPVLEAWGLGSLVYVTFIYGWFFPWYLIMPMALVFASPPTRTAQRLGAICNRLGIAWMLLYGVLLHP